MTTLVLGFMQPNRLWALALIPVIAGVYWYLANRLPPSQTQNSRLRLVIPKDAAWKRHGAVLLARACRALMHTADYSRMLLEKLSDKR